MNKYEYIQELKSALTGNMHDFEIESNIKFYEEYFDSKIKEGKTAGQVADELGSPRLIAKTLIDTSNVPYNNGSERNTSSKSSYTETNDDDYLNTDKKKFSIKRILFNMFFDREKITLFEKIIIGFIFFFISVMFVFLLYLMFRIISGLIPFIMLFILVLFVIAMIKSR